MLHSRPWAAFHPDPAAGSGQNLCHASFQHRLLTCAQVSIMAQTGKIVYQDAVARRLIPAIMNSPVVTPCFASLTLCAAPKDAPLSLLPLLLPL
jgi:hypothetical protein